MKHMHELVPDPQMLKGMHPAQIAHFLLDILSSMGPDDAPMRHRGNLARQIATGYAPPRQPVDRLVMVAVLEGWSWLETHQLIVQDPDQSDGWCVVTARGDTVWKSGGVQRFVASQQLPESMLHPALQGQVRLLYLSRDFDTAVFKAFHELEVSIREAAGFGNELIGTKLVYRAFDQTDGPLMDPEAEPGERQALTNLMAGAIGSYKNPQSHRRVGLDANTARELLVLASHLLGIVDSRRKG